ncbi:MAG: acyl-CoA thioesterase [Ignavibacteriaceae bacterium]|nr:acyl-CoA thioesterase [Ignavibacteriaceae bacterium]
MSYYFKGRISFHDCDPAGIMFFAKIYSFMHSAYEEMISSYNLDEDYWNNQNYVVPIIECGAKYRAPFKYGDNIEIQIDVTQVRSSSFELSYKCFNQNQILCVEGQTVHVHIDKKLWKKKKMSEKLFNSLSKV